MFMNAAVSHLHVSKPDLHAASTWSLLAKVSPINLQASVASMKFSCSAVFLLTRVTPIILHCTEMESSAKESHGEILTLLLSLFVALRLLFLEEHCCLDAPVRSLWLGYKFRSNSYKDILLD